MQGHGPTHFAGVPARRTLLTLALLLTVAPAAAAGPFDDAKAIVTDGAKLATRSADAEAKFREAARQDPSNAHAFYNLGLLARMRGDFAVAEAAWRDALRADSGYLPAKARLAELDLERGDEGAVKRLEAIIADNRFQPEARNILAGRALDSEDWESAIKHARNVLLGDPENVNAYVNLALAYLRQDLDDQALLIASNALDRRPEAAALHNIMGLIFLRKDDSRAATESFLAALKHNPRQVDAKLNLAALELAYGDFRTALGRFDEVIEVRPNDAMLVISRAVALRGLGRFEEARAGYEAALILKPELPAALYNLCVLHHQYLNQGLAQWQAARSLCRRYQATIDKDHPTWRETGSRLKSIDATIQVLMESQPAPGAEPAPTEGAEASPAGGTP